MATHCQLLKLVCHLINSSYLPIDNRNALHKNRAAFESRSVFGVKVRAFNCDQLLLLLLLLQLNRTACARAHSLYLLLDSRGQLVT